MGAPMPYGNPGYYGNSGSAPNGYSGGGYPPQQYMGGQYGAGYANPGYGYYPGGQGQGQGQQK
jgi:hypothetical protein